MALIKVELNLPDPARKFVGALFGLGVDAADSVSQRLRLYQVETYARIVGTASELCAKHHIQPKKLPFKFLIPFFEKCSLEDEPELFDRWAALLATATADFSRRHLVYADMLEHLGAAEAAILKSLVNVRLDGEFGRHQFIKATVDQLIASKFSPTTAFTEDATAVLQFWRRLADTLKEFETIISHGQIETPKSGGATIIPFNDQMALERRFEIENLVRLQLVERNFSSRRFFTHSAYAVEWVMLTDLGADFIATCEGKKIKKPAE